MGDDNDNTKWLIDNMKTTGAKPVAAAWYQALEGKISVEEAAAQRQGIDPQEEILACKELFRPPSELDAQRRLKQIMAHARPPRWKPVIAASLAVAAAVALFVILPREPGTMPDLPPYGRVELTSAVAQVRGDGPTTGGEPARHRMDSPVRWRVPAQVDDALQDAKASSLHVYATAAGQVRRLDLEFVREASGTFTVRAPSLRRAFGDDWPTGETQLTFVVARPKISVPDTADELLSCVSSAEIKCLRASIIIE